MYSEKTLSLSTLSPAYINARNYYHYRVQKQPTTVGEFCQCDVDILKEWMLEQGANLVFCDNDSVLRVADSYGVALGRDIVEFDCEKEMTKFLLRWS